MCQNGKPSAGAFASKRIPCSSRPRPATHAGRAPWGSGPDSNQPTPGGCCSDSTLPSLGAAAPTPHSRALGLRPRLHTPAPASHHPQRTPPLSRRAPPRLEATRARTCHTPRAACTRQDDQVVHSPPPEFECVASFFPGPRPGPRAPRRAGPPRPAPLPHPDIVRCRPSHPFSPHHPAEDPVSPHRRGVAWRAPRASPPRAQRLGHCRCTWGCSGGHPSHPHPLRRSLGLHLTPPPTPTPPRTPPAAPRPSGPQPQRTPQRTPRQNAYLHAPRAPRRRRQCVLGRFPCHQGQTA